MYQFITTIQASKGSKSTILNFMTINVLCDTSSNMLVAKGQGLKVFPSGHFSQGVTSKIPLNEKFDMDEVLENYSGFRRHIFALVCEHIHENFLDWTVL